MPAPDGTHSGPPSSSQYCGEPSWVIVEKQLAKGVNIVVRGIVGDKVGDKVGAGEVIVMM